MKPISINSNSLYIHKLKKNLSYINLIFKMKTQLKIDGEKYSQSSL